MTATVTPVTIVPTTGAATERRPVWKSGVVAGLGAAVAVTAVAAAARAVDIPLDIDGESIPLAGFAQLTHICTVLGVLLARVIGRRSASPRTRFVQVTVALTALSLVPDLTAQTGTASKLVLMLTHAVAAAIVIPTLAGRLAERRS